MPEHPSRETRQTVWGTMGHSKNLMEEIIVMESQMKKLGKVRTIEDAQLYRPQACSAYQGFKAPIRAGFAVVRIGSTCSQSCH